MRHDGPTRGIVKGRKIPCREGKAKDLRLAGRQSFGFGKSPQSKLRSRQTVIRIFTVKHHSFLAGKDSAGIGDGNSCLYRAALGGKFRADHFKGRVGKTEAKRIQDFLFCLRKRFKITVSDKISSE